MRRSPIDRPPALPLVLQRRSNDEFRPPPYSATDRQVLARVLTESPALAHRAHRPLADYWSGRLGTAAALRAIDEASGGGFYPVPPEAAIDPAAAEEAFGGDELVIDVQTHYIAKHRAQSEAARNVLGMIQRLAPDRWKGLNGALGLGLAEFLRCIFLESETAVAVLTSSAGQEARGMLSNDEMAGTRELIDRLAGTGRLLNHAVANPNRPGELEQMGRLKEQYRPVGWKVYTLHGNPGWRGGEAGWMLDDEACGLPFLERSRELGVTIVCAHKGFSALAPTGSPKDVGPAAAAFPEMQFLIYHSGYEPPRGDTEEGPYAEAVAKVGSNRLVKSLKEAGIKPGSNVYAELGSTWFVLMRRPREAAHVLGKMLLAVGEDNILWGTDCIWYGSPQPLIDALRAFEIPEAMRERYGYPELTPAIKEKVLGLNAARVYGIDVEQVRARVRNDDLAWARAALEEYVTRGTPSV